MCGSKKGETLLQSIQRYCIVSTCQSLKEESFCMTHCAWFIPLYTVFGAHCPVHGSPSLHRLCGIYSVSVRIMHSKRFYITLFSWHLSQERKKKMGNGHRQKTCQMSVRGSYGALHIALTRFPPPPNFISVWVKYYKITLTRNLKIPLLLYAGQAAGEGWLYWQSLSSCPWKRWTKRAYHSSGS